MSVKPLVELTKSGQSIWYDGIDRGPLKSGDLNRLITNMKYAASPQTRRFSR